MTFVSVGSDGLDGLLFDAHELSPHELLATHRNSGIDLFPQASARWHLAVVHVHEARFKEAPNAAVKCAIEGRGLHAQDAGRLRSGSQFLA
jgi:hypothetical protein